MQSFHVPCRLAGAIVAALGACGLVPSPAAAAAPAIDVWSSEGRFVRTALDRIETNQAYVASRQFEASGRVANTVSEGAVRVEDLMLRLVLPEGAAFRLNDSGTENGVWFCQWDAGQTSLVARLAEAATNGVEFRLAPELVASNAWVQPRVAVSRACDRTQIGALGAITQQCIVVVTVPPGSLAGLTNLEVRLPDWNIPAEMLEVSPLSHFCPAAFEDRSSGSFPDYLAPDAASLAGAYAFTNTLFVSNKTALALRYMPEVEVRYTERSGSEDTAPQAALRQDYGNGTGVIASAPQPVVWRGTWDRGLTSLSLLAKCLPVNAPPGLTDIRIVRARYVSANGLTSGSFMLSAEGSNLLAAVVRTPGNRSFDMQMEDTTGLYFDPASCAAGDLAEFTNGTYRIDLLDFTNGAAATYSFALRGAGISQTPVLLTPPGLSTPDPRPMLSWGRATNANASAVLLILNNAWLSSESFNMWPGTSVTNYLPDSDLFACVGWSLVFGDLLMTNSGAAGVMSGYATFREGLFNVVSNGFNLPAVHLAAGPVSAVTGDAVTLSVPTYGFFTGGAVTLRLLFGDGEEAFGASAAHAYATSGVYTARVIATDGTGAAATGSVTVTVHPAPLFSSTGRASGGKIALSFPTVSGAVYRAQFADDLRDPSWGPLAMVTSGTGGTMSVRTSGTLTQRFYRLTCQLPGTAEPGAFAPLAFPFRNTGDVVRLAAYGIPNWGGTEPHNGIDLQIDGALASAEIISPATGTVTGIRVDEMTVSDPPGQLLVDVTILSPDGLEVHLVLEPSTTNAVLKAAQIAAVHVSEGQEVAVGAPVADLLVGTLGYPHLHYMLMRGGEFVCAYGYSSPEAQAIFEAMAAYPTNNLPDGNISYGEP